MAECDWQRRAWAGQRILSPSLPSCPELVLGAGRGGAELGVWEPLSLGRFGNDHIAEREMTVQFSVETTT